MGLFSFLSKPDWQSRDAGKRAAGVAAGRDPALLEALPQILRQDPDPGVRRAALDRVGDPTVVADRMRNDSHAALREHAKARLLDLLSTGELTLELRLRALGLVEDAAMLEQLARRAGDAGLRRAALERCARAGFLAERCLEDPDPAIRLLLLERIEQPATLERIAEQARTRDKRLARAARDRLEQGRRSSGETGSLQAQAEALCQRVEALVKAPGADAETVLQAIEAQWLELRPRIDARLDTRFAGGLDTLRAAIAAIARRSSGDPVQKAASPPLADDPASTAEPDIAAEPQAAAAAPGTGAAAGELAVAVQGETAAEAVPSAEGEPPPVQAEAGEDPQETTTEDAAPPAAPGKREPAVDLEPLQARAEQAHGELREALENGRLQQARQARARLIDALQAMPANARRPGERALRELEPELEKLAQWQRWSDNKQRQRLCDEAEALIGSGIHPDALATRIAEMRQAWQRIDDSERDPAAGELKESGLARRFRFLCHRALEPAKGYFEKRREVRGRRAGEIEEFLHEAEGKLAADSLDHAGLIALKQQAADRLRRIDEEDPRKRSEHGRRLRQLIESLSKSIDSRFAAVAAEKQKLLAQLRRQLAHAELDQALDLAKAAQKRWQSLGRGSRKTDQALWEELRALVDPWFAQKNQQLQAEDDERAAGQAAARELVDRMQALAASGDDSARLLQQIEQVEQQWRSEDRRPRELERAYDSAVERARQHAARRAFDEREASAAALRALAAELDTLEAAWIEQGPDAMASAALESCTAALAALPAAQANLLADRLAALQAGSGQPADSALVQARADEARALLLEYEFLAGIESPPEYRQARLARQVERLAQRINQGASSDTRDRLGVLEQSWWRIGLLAGSERQALAARRERALAALREA